jgi:hypothetical protein
MADQVLADAPTGIYSASVEHIDLRDLRARHVPDVPEDVDFLMEHLNDPNFDLTSKPAESLRKTKKEKYESSDIDTESQFDSDRYSTSRAESQITAVDDFDE